MDFRLKKLIKHTGILAIGTFGSKILSFLIVPFYTYVLTTKEYGTIDLFTTMINLMVPFVTFQCQEAMIRYAVGNEYDSQVILNNCYAIFGFGIGISTLCFPVYYYFFPDFALMYYVFLILSSFTGVFSHYLRIVGKNLEYSINGILVTGITVLSNIVFLLGLKWGIKGYLFSMMLAQLISTIYVIACGHLVSLIDFSKIDRKIVRVILHYSIPLIPNTLMWWIMNAGDKFIISIFLGVDANGIYALAMKIPTIIQLFYSIFMMAWQVSAIETMKGDNISKYYEEVLTIVGGILSFGTSLIIFLVKPVFTNLMNESYVVAWKYVPFLCVSMILSCYASFFGVFYNMYKVNKRVLVTTAYATIINVITNFFFVRFLDLYGIAIGTITGYVVMTIIRIRDTERLLETEHISIKKEIIALFILIIESIIAVNAIGICYYLLSAVSVCLILNIYLRDIVQGLTKMFIK